MGNSSSSSVTQENNVYVVNRSAIDIMNETNTNIVNNTIINIAKSASASATSTQDTTIDNITAGKDSTVDMAGISQDQKAVLNFSSVQSTTVVMQASAEIVNRMLQQITSNVDNSVLTKMIAEAEAVNKAAFMAPPATSTDSSVNIKNTTELTSETFTKLRNVVNNSVTNNFTTSSVDSCLSSLVSAQKLKIGSITAKDGGSVNLGLLSQSQSLSLLAKCDQVSSAMNSVTNNLVQDFNADIKEDKKNKTETEMDAEAKSENTATGLFEGLGSMFSGLFSGLSTLTGGILGSSVLVSLCCCCCCILLIIMMMIPKGG